MHYDFLVWFCWIFFPFMKFFVHYFIVWEDWLPQSIRVIKSKLKEVPVKWKNTIVCFLPWNFTVWQPYASSRRKIALLAPFPEIQLVFVWRLGYSFCTKHLKRSSTIINLFKLSSNMNTKSPFGEGIFSKTIWCSWSTKQFLLLSLLMSVIGV